MKLGGEIGGERGRTRCLQYDFRFHGCACLVRVQKYGILSKVARVVTQWVHHHDAEARDLKIAGLEMSKLQSPKTT